ncbi:MAG: hypothetical protein IJ251_00630 [Oscillospiraceae bacterium]|nr:hypothetical protein [Oscillospiraceae bacterium]
MGKLFKRLSCTFGIALMLAVFTPVLYPSAEAKEQAFGIHGQVYEFDNKSEYKIDSSSASSTTDKSVTLGSLSIEGDISNDYTQDGYAAYEIANNTVFSVSYKYSSNLRDAGAMDWHLTEDSKKMVNGVSLDGKIKKGAVILQTSLDGNKWSTGAVFTDISTDVTFDQENGINNIQLANGCYYRIIVAYETEKQLESKKILFVDTSKHEYKKYAEVYQFYASYKDTDTTPTGEKYYFYAGAKNSAYTVKTKKNNYAGSETIDSKDPHYGWDMGYFCLSGYTDKGDSDDVYLKKVGNKVKLTFRLDQDINKLNGNSDLIIENDKDGSDEEFKVLKHNMKHGELIIRHTDSENNNTEVNYSDYLAALASPGADTSIQLFEEGDYEVHLNYAITDKEGIDSTTYYQTSFRFRIRNANCMVYIFDSETKSELNSGAVTKNGFSIDTANSKYIKIAMTKQIFNDNCTALIDAPKFNGAVSNGESFTDEGVYTIYAYNPDLEKVKNYEATIYVGSNNILAAYTKHNNKSEHYTIAQLKNMEDNGYTITENGDIFEPVIETTTIQPETESAETSSGTAEVTSESSAVTTSEPVASETTDSTSVSVSDDERDNKSVLPIVGGGAVAAVIVGTGAMLQKKRK